MGIAYSSYSSVFLSSHGDDDCRLHGPGLAFFVFVYSLQFVAKSGEVWCEGGRIFLNPCSTLFSIHNAQYCLNLAVYFTPQYGDSFIEVFFLE